jgi:hypothetical protein
MAITLPYTIAKLGLTLPYAYVKIENFTGNKTDVGLCLGVYASAEARQAGRQPVARRGDTVPLPAAAPNGVLPALYNALKMQPEFAGAQDC